MILLCDIDGTLADFTTRAHDAGVEPDRAYPEEHEAWCKKVQDTARLAKDPVVPGMKYLIQQLARQCKIVYCTARDEEHMEVTLMWLKNNQFPNGPLVMRKSNDKRSASEYKESVLKEIKSEKPNTQIIAIDDCGGDPHMSLMFRAHGVLHLQPMWCRYTEDGEEVSLYGK